MVEGAPSIGVEQLLEFSQLLLVLLNLRGRFLVALVVVLEPLIDVLEPYFAAGRHSESIDIFHLEPPIRMLGHRRRNKSLDQ